MKVLDSSFCADFLRGRDAAREYRLDHQAERLVLPAVSLYELYHGAVKEGRDPAEVDENLPWVQHLDYDPAHSLESAHIQQELADAGQRIQHPDMMLAGVARSLGVPIVTSDGGFQRVPGLEVENHRETY